MHPWWVFVVCDKRENNGHRDNRYNLSVTVHTHVTCIAYCFCIINEECHRLFVQEEAWLQIILINMHINESLNWKSGIKMGDMIWVSGWFWHTVRVWAGEYLAHQHKPIPWRLFHDFGTHSGFCNTCCIKLIPSSSLRFLFIKIIPIKICWVKMNFLTRPLIGRHY